MKKQLVLAAMISVLFANSYGCSEEDMIRDRDAQANVMRSVSPVMAQVPQEQRDEENRKSNQPNARMSASPVMDQIPQGRRGRRGWKSRLRALGITAIGVGTGIVLLYAGHLLLHAIEMYKFRNILGDIPWFMR